MRSRRHYVESVTSATQWLDGVMTLESILNRKTVLPAPHSKKNNFNRCDIHVKFKGSDTLYFGTNNTVPQWTIMDPVPIPEIQRWQLAGHSEHIGKRPSVVHACKSLKHKHVIPLF